MYLSSPPPSVYFERIFSEAGNLYKEKQNRLLPKTGKKLLFTHNNLKNQEYVSLWLNGVDMNDYI